eukprot:gene6448-7730_t
MYHASRMEQAWTIVEVDSLFGRARARMVAIESPTLANAKTPIVPSGIPECALMLRQHALVTRWLHLSHLETKRLARIHNASWRDEALSHHVFAEARGDRDNINVTVVPLEPLIAFAQHPQVSCRMRYGPFPNASHVLHRKLSDVSSCEGHTEAHWASDSKESADEFRNLSEIYIRNGFVFDRVYIWSSWTPTSNMQWNSGVRRTKSIFAHHDIERWDVDAIKNSSRNIAISEDNTKRRCFALLYCAIQNVTSRSLFLASLARLSKDSPIVDDLYVATNGDRYARVSAQSRQAHESLRRLGVRTHFWS